jgi:hypothetical protein
LLIVFVRSSQASLDALVNFFTVYGYIFGCVDANSDLLAADT